MAGFQCRSLLSRTIITAATVTKTNDYTYGDQLNLTGGWSVTFPQWTAAKHRGWRWSCTAPCM
eukprot:scaffold95591_cov28-Tisochrysis_lutea.AAC.1